MPASTETRKLTPPPPSTVTTQTNPRGIPVAPFIDNVSDYEPTLRSFQEMISKYQFMEVNTQRRGQGLREKIPDIKKTLEMVRFLQLRKEVNIPPPVTLFIICNSFGGKKMLREASVGERKKTKLKLKSGNINSLT